MDIPKITVTFETEKGSKDAAIEFYSFYVAEGNERYLDRAVNTLESILEQSDGGSSQFSLDFKDLFVMLSARRICTKSWADLEKLRELDQLRQEPPSLEESNVKDWLETMAQTKWALFRSEGYAWTGLLDDTIALLDQLRRMTALTDPDLVNTMYDLSRALTEQSLLRVDLGEIDRAVAYANEARQLAAKMSSAHPRMSKIFFAQGQSLARRHHINRNMSDLDAAIDTVGSAIRFEDESTAKQYAQRFLVVLLCERYEGRRTEQDLVDAEKFMSDISKGPYDELSTDLLLLTTLAAILHRKHDGTFKHQSEDVLTSNDIEQMDALPDRYYAVVTRLLDYCGPTQNMAEVDETLKCLERLIKVISSDCVEEWIVLDGLCDNFELKFAYTGDVKWLEKSDTYACELPDPETVSVYQDRARGSLSRLAMKFHARYKRYGSTEDSMTALNLARRELDENRENSCKNIWLSNLAVIGETYYRWSKEIDVLEDILSRIEFAEPWSSGNSDFPLDFSPPFLLAVAVCHLQKWSISGNREALDRSVYYARYADYVVSPHSAYRSGAAFVLGCASMDRYYNPRGAEAGGGNDEKEQDLSMACQCYLEVWHNNFCSPFLRAGAAKECLALFWDSDQDEEFKTLARELIEFLPSLASRPFNFDRQRVHAEIYTGIASILCAGLLELNATDNTALAFECLELGRTVALREYNDWHSILKLEEHDPDLRARYQSLREEISLPVPIAEARIHSEVAEERREIALRDYEQLLEEIRNIPTLSVFQVGRSLSEIQSCISQRCVIVVNVADWRSDAFIVTPTQLVHMALPKLKADELRARLAKQWKGRRSELGEGNKKYCKFLSWLWENGVKDIMFMVDRTVEPLSRRICWIGCGQASGLPFHAAGNHDEPENSVMSKAISSYAPSFNQLAQSQARCLPDHSEHSMNVLIVTMAKTKGYPNLPIVEEESMAIQEILGENFQVLLLNREPSANLVEQHISSHHVAHFACHGRVSTSDIYGCGLIFLGPKLDGEIGEDLLSLRRLATLDLDGGKIAYLSACSTAENNWVQRADENLTVVCGFQTAGFRHVIGCLWKSVDDICKSVSQSFYRSLSQQGCEKWDDDLVALALHDAVLKLKTQYPKRPLLWAQFVHYGP